ncbi:MAG: SRPBCC family protein [Vicingaceae bacterium]|nr:SRPBCC family protein [Vicingaceae bacterium]
MDYLKYTCTIEINLPITKVIELWDNEIYFSKWQDGFQSIENIEGLAGRVGTKSKILLQQGKRKMELIETIITNNLPTDKKALYEHIHMTNTQTTRFESINKNKTLYISEVEYTKFNGFAPKLMAKLFPSMFKKQSQKWMNQFKVFAEEYSN